MKQRLLRKVYTLLLGLLLITINIPSFGQTFPCDGSLRFGFNSGNIRTTLAKVTFGPFGAIFYERTNNYFGVNLNSLGFNPQDNYIYAVRAGSNEIVRLKSDNTFEVVGNVPVVDELVSTAGDCTPTGLYLCHDQNLNQILVFNVVDGFELVNRIDLFWDSQSINSGPFTTRIDALAIDPNNPTVAYSYQGDYFGTGLDPVATKGYFLEIDLDFQGANLGRVRPIAEIPRNAVYKIGSLFFGANGGLYAHGAGSRGPDPTMNRFLNINQNTGEATVRSTTAPSGTNSDGCSCPYNVSFTNVADPNFALCSDSKTKYTLTVTNRFFLDIPNATIIDTFPEGMIISGISRDYIPNVADGTGVGTRVLRLDNLNIPSKARISIDVDIQVVELPIESIPNQAILTNLPERFEDQILSDDPSTLGTIGDPTNIFSDPQRLENFTVDITNPTDCFSESGKIVITSSILIPGNEYTIGLEDREFNRTETNVIIDEENTFMLDSLAPSRYRLFKIKPVDSECTFAMKDTFLTVMAPNHLLQAEVFDNSPVCEGATLNLSAEVSPPEGMAIWSSPRIFRHVGTDLTIDSATVDESGEYQMVFSLGYCEQIRTLDIEVAPSIEANINSPDRFCERDTMRLFAQGVGNLESFDWLDPSGNLSSDSLIEIPFASSENEGIYELIIDNGLCRDTVRKYISVSPSTTLELPSVLKSNFCEPLRLNPELSGPTNVTYEWTPVEGLSCADCPNPVIDTPIVNQYNLKVINEFACQDSASVEVFIDEESLIYFPNAFSPNDDGINDYFQVFPNCSVASIDEFRVFDRFGGMVYSLKGADKFSDPRMFWNGWDEFVGANPGVYVWFLKMTLIDGTKRSFEGDVNVFR